MAEEPDRRFGLQSSSDLLKGERGNAEGELCLRHARLNAKDLDKDVAVSQLGLGHLLKAHVPETVELPRSHRSGLCGAGCSVSVRHQIAAGRPRTLVRLQPGSEKSSKA